MSIGKLQHNIEGIVCIAHDLHATSEAALNQLLEFLAEDYDIKDGNLDEERPYDSYWCKLKESVCTKVCKCDFCQHNNSRNGSCCEGYTCANCGKVLYQEYLEGTVVRFTFRAQTEWHKDVSLVVRRYDHEKRQLVCYPDYYASNSWSAVSEEEFPIFMEKHKDAYTEIEENGQKFLLFTYSRNGYLTEDIKINMSETHPHRDGRGRTQIHYETFYVYKELELKTLFGMGDGLPVPETLSVYPTFRHRPNPVTHQDIIHAARQVSRIDYYYQDGRPAFFEPSLEWMALYVENFTNLPADRFRKFLKNCHKDARGFITGMAHWVQKYTSEEPVIEDEPNVGNFMVGLAKMGSGQSLSRGEERAFLKSFDDPSTHSLVKEVTGSDRNRHLRESNS